MALMGKLKTIGPTVRTLDTSRAPPPPKTADEHYGTPEHREWRRLVIERALGRCQWPGCGKVETKMYADHIVEIKDGGYPLDPDNGQCLCASHHSQKTIAARAARIARPTPTG